jgi:hypothetical protein
MTTNELIRQAIDLLEKELDIPHLKKAGAKSVDMAVARKGLASASEEWTRQFNDPSEADGIRHLLLPYVLALREQRELNETRRKQSEAAVASPPASVESPSTAISPTAFPASTAKPLHRRATELLVTVLLAICIAFVVVAALVYVAFEWYPAPPGVPSGHGRNFNFNLDIADLLSGFIASVGVLFAGSAYALKTLSENEKPR